MKKLLVPCDFSKPAIEAVKFATAIAKKERGEITLFHSIPLPTLYNSDVIMAFEASYMKESKETAERELLKLAKKWIGPNIKVRYDVRWGSLMQTLEEALKKSKADAVVMGTHGASGIKEYVIGSNAEKVVRNSPVPVICVKKSINKIKNLVFPVDPDDDQEELTMKVKYLQEFFGSRLHLVFVNTPAVFKRDFETMPVLENYAKRYMLKNFSINIFNDVSEAEGIINFTETVGADMIAMRTHGRRGLVHLAAGSVTEDIVNHVSCPVWTFRIR